MTENKNYRGIILLSMVGKIYAGILIDNEQGGFRAERGYADQIFTQECENMESVCWFYGFLEGI